MRHSYSNTTATTDSNTSVSNLNHLHDLIMFSRKFNSVKSEIIQHCISHPSSLQNYHMINAILDFDESGGASSYSHLVLYKQKNEIIRRWKCFRSASVLTNSDIRILCS